MPDCRLSIRYKKADIMHFIIDIDSIIVYRKIIMRIFKYAFTTSNQNK